MSDNTLLSLIGNTPIVKITKFDTGLCTLYAKLENQNPCGSIKDRIALTVIEEAEKTGKLKPGGTIIEATAGNTGLGLGLVAALKGYKLILVIPDKMSREKLQHLQALGAKIILTRSDVGKGHPEFYQDLAEKIYKETPGSYYFSQFTNPINPYAHEIGTGPEILKQMDNDIDAIICGVGSGGTATGLGRFFAKNSPKTEIVIADPVGSIVKHFVETKEILNTSGPSVVEGIGSGSIPSVSDLSYAKKAYSISDLESLTCARELLTKEAIFGGSSTGTLLAAALKYCNEQTVPKKVMFFVCDSGNKYLSKMFDDTWMYDQGFIKRKSENNLLDLITRRFEEGATVSISPDNTIMTALSRMSMYSVSQLPVLEGSKLVGIVDEMDLLIAVSQDKENFKKQIVGFMTTELTTFKPTDTVDMIFPLFEQGKVAIVKDGEQFIGLITKIDVLNYLKRGIA